MAIEHLTNLDAEASAKVVAAIRNRPSDFRFTEKYDGTCNASMAISLDGDEVKVGLTRPSKNKPEIIYSQDHISSSPHHNCLRRALEVFQAIGNQIHLVRLLQKHDEKEVIIEFEILVGLRPNTIKYGTNNTAIPLRILGPQTVNNVEIFEEFCRLIKGEFFQINVPIYKYITENGGMNLTWNIKSERFDVHMIKEYSFDQLDSIFRFSSALEHAGRVDLLNKGVKLIGSSLNVSVPVEGVVIQHKVTNTLYKIVNKEEFTKNNNLIWDVRSMIAGGRMKNGTWRKSYYQVMLDDMAEILGVPVLKTPMAIKHFREDHEKASDMVERAYTNILAANSILEAIRNRYDKYNRDMSMLYLKYVERQSKDDPPYDEEINERTEQSFFHMLTHNKKILEPMDKLFHLDFEDAKFRRFLKKLMYRLVIT